MTTAATLLEPGGRFLVAPIDLLQKFSGRPLVPGIYLGLARLGEVAQQPVPASRADLAAWCGPDVTRDTGLATGIKRAIDDLRPLGWLATETGPGRKLWLAPAWGLGRDGRARAWRWSRRDRGRPERLRFVRVPLELFDLYLGALYPDPDDPARSESLFDQALLQLADIGAYAQRLAGVRVAPARLVRLKHLGLVDERGIPQPPRSRQELLQLALGGQLTTLVDGELAVVNLSAEGRRLSGLHQVEAVSTAVAADGAQDGSVLGSMHGSSALTPDPAPQSTEQAASQLRDTAWERSERSIEPTKIPPTEHVGMQQPAPGQEDLASLDPIIQAGHRALNSARIIPTGEWWALRMLQVEHGRQALLAWQRRAAGAGRTEVRLAYYERCAAAAAFAQARPARPPTDERGATAAPAEATAVGSERPGLTAEQLEALRELEAAAGEPVRAPWRIVAATPELLRAWARRIAEPGLHAYCRLPPLHYAVDQLAQGLQPPSADQLARWAARAAAQIPRERWSDDTVGRAVRTYGDLFRRGSDTTDLDAVMTSSDDVAPGVNDAPAALLHPGANMHAPHDDGNPDLGSKTPLEQHGVGAPVPLAEVARSFELARQVRVLLRQRCDPSYHSVLTRLQIAVGDGVTEVRCATIGDRSVVEGVLMVALSAILAEVGLPPPTVAAPQVAPPARPPDPRRARWSV
ncbi:MAG TPA: hypothetical protein VFS21_30700 [Roseiflexaceae bacterium]|nr:hypothetical protein [Roseiflexaceae bacterium]